MRFEVVTLGAIKSRSERESAFYQLEIIIFRNNWIFLLSWLSANDEWFVNTVLVVTLKF